MVKLIHGCSYSRIIGLTPGQFKALQKKLSYNVGSYFSGYGTYKKSLLNKRGEFPTGLQNIVHTFTIENGIHYVYTRSKDLYINKIQKDISIKVDICPYDWQVNAALAAEYINGTVVAPTGSGKSMAMFLAIERLKLKTLIVVPTVELKNQLKTEVKRIFNNPNYIIVENIDSKSLIKKNDYGLLIIDEVHHAAAKTYQKLNKKYWDTIPHRVCFTATPFRNDPEEELLFKSIAGDVIYELEYDEAVRKGYIVPVDSFYIPIPSQQTEAYSYNQVYSELVVNNDFRNAAIVELIEKLKENDVYTLILVKEVKHGEILSDRTEIPFVNGKDEESRSYIKEFNSGKIKVLIGTEAMLGEGIDTKPCEYVVIAGLGKARSAFMQKVGRSLRRYPGKESGKVIIFYDKSHKFLVRHFKAQKKILVDEYGSKPVELKI